MITIYKGVSHTAIRKNTTRYMQRDRGWDTRNKTREQSDASKI